MLRTLGASRRQIVTTVVVEAFAIGLAASIVGLLAGIGFAPAIGALFGAVGIDLPSSGSVIAPRTVVVSLLIGTGIAVLASLLPALRATRIQPIAGLREGAALETPRERGRRGAAGVALAVLGLAVMTLGLFGALDPAGAWLGVGAVAVFIGVALLSPRLVAPMASVVGRPLERFRGVPGRIARENAVRNPGRTAVTAAALMIGLALVSFVAVFAAGLRGSIDDAIDKTIVGDLYIANNDGFSDIPGAHRRRGGRPRRRRRGVADTLHPGRGRRRLRRRLPDAARPGHGPAGAHPRMEGRLAGGARQPRARTTP